MSFGRKLYWVIVAATILVFGAMVLWAAPQIRGDSGLLLFDEQLSYSHGDAVAFLAAITEDARALYLLELRLLDTLFPVLFALTLVIGIYHLSRDWPFLARFAALLPPVLGAVFDLRENAAVAEMLLAGPEVLTSALSADATFWTSLKWFMDLCAGATLIALMFFSILGKLLGRDENR